MTVQELVAELLSLRNQLAEVQIRGEEGDWTRNFEVWTTPSQDTVRIEAT